MTRQDYQHAEVCGHFSVDAGPRERVFRVLKLSRMTRGFLDAIGIEERKRDLLGDYRWEVRRVLEVGNTRVMDAEDAVFLAIVHKSLTFGHTPPEG